MTEFAFSHTAGAPFTMGRIECPRGEELVIALTMLDSSGAARDTSGGTVSFSWERQIGTGSPNRVTAAGGVSGVHEITISSDTTQLLDGTYRCDAWFTPATGSPEKLSSNGALVIIDSIGP